MKNSSKLKFETNSKVYKRQMRKLLDSYEGVCPYCHPHGGCNYWRFGKKQKNWKRYRKYQWKD